MQPDDRTDTARPAPQPVLAAPAPDPRDVPKVRRESEALFRFDDWALI